MRKEHTMEYNIREQIDTWQKKLLRYEQKETRLRERIAISENLRKNVDEMPVGSPKVDRFYRSLAELYTQLDPLLVKIRHCKDNIATLECELLWN